MLSTTFNSMMWNSASSSSSSSMLSFTWALHKHRSQEQTMLPMGTLREKRPHQCTGSTRLYRPQPHNLYTICPDTTNNIFAPRKVKVEHQLSTRWRQLVFDRVFDLLHLIWARAVGGPVAYRLTVGPLESRWAWHNHCGSEHEFGLTVHRTKVWQLTGLGYRQSFRPIHCVAMVSLGGHKKSAPAATRARIG